MLEGCQRVVVQVVRLLTVVLFPFFGLSNL
jgi:hypothetical protein